MAIVYYPMAFRPSHGRLLGDRQSVVIERLCWPAAESSCRAYFLGHWPVFAARCGRVYSLPPYTTVPGWLQLPGRFDHVTDPRSTSGTPILRSWLVKPSGIHIHCLTIQLLCLASSDQILS